MPSPFTILFATALLCASCTEKVGNPNLDRSVANVISDAVKVLCWILTSAERHATRAVHIKNTWGKRCDILLFVSTVQDPALPSIALSAKEGADHRWNRVKDAFKYIYKHHYGDAQWFMKVDDNTYVVVENLKYMLYGFNWTLPLYLGNQMKKTKLTMRSRNKKTIKEHIYMSGSGYVLSKEALRQFVEVAFFNPPICQHELDGEHADLEMGICMEALKIPPIDTRDDKGRERFIGIHPQYLLTPIVDPANKWYWQASVHNISTGMECCSMNPVSFHQIKPAEMYLLDYVLYHLRPFGVNYVSEAIPSAVNVTRHDSS